MQYKIILYLQRKKIEVLKKLLDKYELSPKNAMYLGDDVNDIECLNYVKYPVTVNNAHSSIKELNGVFVTERCGGDGAFREVTDYLL